MKILLPNYDIVLCGGNAEVKDHALYLYRYGIYNEVMYELAYLLFGSDECYYCHRKLQPENEPKDSKKYFQKISLDHRDPKDLGGLNATNNLRPACTECNTRKGNMFEAEFYEYLRVRKRTRDRGKEGRQEMRLFREKIMLTQELRRYGKILCLPEKWITEMDLKQIWICCWLGQKKGGSYGRMVENYLKYGFLLNPIIVSAEGILLDGFNAHQVALDYGIQSPIVVQEENVFYRGLPFGERSFLT